MKRFLVIPAAAMLMLGTVAPMHAMAADAAHPHRNVNKKNDMGNRTGDSEVDRLNAQELAKIQGGTTTGGSPMSGGSMSGGSMSGGMSSMPMGGQSTAAGSMVTQPTNSGMATPRSMGSGTGTNTGTGGATSK